MVKTLRCKNGSAVEMYSLYAKTISSSSIAKLGPLFGVPMYSVSEMG